MVSDPPEADFIILDSRPGKDRDQWLKVVKDLKVTFYAYNEYGLLTL